MTITTSSGAFNGASDGKMTITVPQNWSVAVNEVNATSVAHSLVITAQGIYMRIITIMCTLGGRARISRRIRR